MSYLHLLSVLQHQPLTYYHCPRWLKGCWLHDHCFAHIYLAASEGHLTIAARLFSAAGAGRVMPGTSVPANEAQLCAPAEAAVAAGLDAASLASARAEGERLGLTEACGGAEHAG